MMQSLKTIVCQWFYINCVVAMHLVFFSRDIRWIFFSFIFWIYFPSYFAHRTLADFVFVVLSSPYRHIQYIPPYALQSSKFKALNGWFVELFVVDLHDNHKSFQILTLISWESDENTTHDDFIYVAIFCRCRSWFLIQTKMHFLWDLLNWVTNWC